MRYGSNFLIGKVAPQSGEKGQISDDPYDVDH